MKIVVLTSSSLPSNTANSIQVMHMASAFSQLGHEVTLIGRIREADSRRVSDSLFHHYGIGDLFKIIRIPWHYRNHLSATQYTLNASFKAWRLRPDLLLSRNVLGSALLATLGMPVIHESHSTEGDSSWIWRIIFSSLVKSKGLIGIVAISESLAHHLEKSHPLLTGKIHVAHDGAVPLSSKQNPKLRRRESGLFTVGYSGSFFPGRGIEIIIAVAKLCPWAQFSLVGDHTVCRLFQDGGGMNLELVGQVPPRTTKDYLKGLDAVLAPYQDNTSDKHGNITAQWMSPLKIFEYMASGVPIIASDLPALNEILTHRENALLVEPDNPEAWVSALMLLRHNSKFAARLASNAEYLLRARFSWKTRAESIINFAARKSC